MLAVSRLVADYFRFDNDMYHVQSLTFSDTVLVCIVFRNFSFKGLSIKATAMQSYCMAASSITGSTALLCSITS